MTSTLASYGLITRDLAASLARTASDPVNARETRYFQDNIGSVTSIDEFLGNQRLYTYAMKAYGLEDVTYAKALMRKVLTEGVDSATSLANRLTDDRYTAFATAFDFKRYGAATTSDAKLQTQTVDAYLRQSLEGDAGDADTGVRLALYFARKAPGLTSAYGILGDAALTQVANTVLGLPATSGAATSGALERRAAAITAKIDIASFKDPVKLDAFVKRFSAIWDARNNAADAPVLGLFNAADTSDGLSADMLLSLQQIRFGR